MSLVPWELILSYLLAINKQIELKMTHFIQNSLTFIVYNSIRLHNLAAYQYHNFNAYLIYFVISC